MSITSETPRKAVYTATQSDKDWLRNVQKKLYERSWENPDYIFRELWGLVTAPQNLRSALERVSRNRGSRSAGVDGLTVRAVLSRGDPQTFLDEIRTELRSGSYRPSPARRVLIPKAGQPGKHRPLGIQTVKDRVVQAAMKYILEPIFEADFYPVSYGFRPGRSAHGALEHLRCLLRPKTVTTASGTIRRFPYQWAIEGDIKGCFDNISAHGLMNRIRRRIGDGKLNRLTGAFLKAGIMAEGQFQRTDNGVPQGGILSPLLANIALSLIEERYQHLTWPRTSPRLLTRYQRIRERAMGNRQRYRAAGKTIFYPIRYADDFIILVGAPPGPNQEQEASSRAEQEKATLAAHLKEELGLELSESKTLVTPVTKAMRFLGHQVGILAHPFRTREVSTTLIPKDRSQRLRETIKALFNRGSTRHSLGDILTRLNPVLRGWSSYFRHAWGAKRVFSAIDHYVWHTILRWLRKKHPSVRVRALITRYGRREPGRRSVLWKDGSRTQFLLSKVKVEPFNLSWLNPPDFASYIYGEPGA